MEKSTEYLATAHDNYENTIRWFNMAPVIVIVLSIFSNNKYINKVAAYFCIPMTLIYIFSYDPIIASLTDPVGRGLSSIRFMSEAFKAFMINNIFRSIFLMILNSLQILILLGMLFKNFEDLKFKKSEILNFILITLGIISLSICTYTPQYYFGNTNIIFKRFSLSHLFVILFMIGEIIALYFIFRNKSDEAKHVLLLALSISLLFQFSEFYTAIGELKMQRLPLQLCNISAYLSLYTIVKRNDKLFHFAIIVNVVGAVLALLILDVNNVGICNYWNAHYILEHTKVVIIPILCLLLKEFKPLEVKDFKHFIIGFSIYYGFVFLVGTTLNAIARATENSYFSVNYLFMFDQKAASGLLPFVGNLFNTKIVMGPVEIYPIIQVLVFVVFVVICFVAFFIIYGCGKIHFKKNKEATI
ncbi:MAG: hypothetical protein ACI311_04225 [Bacilli bacterium]